MKRIQDIREKRIEESRSDQLQFSERKENSRSDPTYETSVGMQSQLTGKALKSLSRFVGRRNIIARGNALGLNDIMNLIAPHSIVVQGDAIAWGKKENIEYRMMNNEYRSKNIIALKGRKIIAQCEALCNNTTTNFFAPHSIVVQGDAIAWGKNNTCLTDKINEENIQYSTINIQRKSWKIEESRSRSFQKEKRTISVGRFLFSAPTERNLIAQGAALCNECNDSIAPRSTVNYGDTVAWGKKENVEYPQRCAFGRITNNECRSIKKLEVRSWKSEVGGKSQSQFSVILKMEERRFLLESIQFLPGETQFPVSEEQFQMEATLFPWSEEQFPLELTSFPWSAEQFPLELTLFPWSVEQFPLELTSFLWSEEQTPKMGNKAGGYSTFEMTATDMTMRIVHNNNLTVSHFNSLLTIIFDNSILQRRDVNYKTIYLN